MKKIKTTLFFSMFAIFLISLPFLLVYSTHTIVMCNGIRVTTDGDRIIGASMKNVTIVFVSRTNNLSVFQVSSVRDNKEEDYQIEVRESGIGLYVVRPYVGSGPGRGTLPLKEVQNSEQGLQKDSLLIKKILVADYSNVQSEYDVLVPWKSNNAIED